MCYNGTGGVTGLNNTSTGGVTGVNNKGTGGVTGVNTYVSSYVDALYREAKAAGSGAKKYVSTVKEERQKGRKRVRS